MPTHLEAVIDDPSTQREANEGDRSPPMLALEQHLGQLLPHLSRPSATHAPRVVDHRGQRQEGGGPGDRRDDAWTRDAFVYLVLFTCKSYVVM